MLPVSKVFELSNTERLMLFEATALLFFSRIAVLLLPFRWVAKPLGSREEGNPRKKPVPESDLDQVEKVGSIIRKVSNHTFWKSNCLAQAISGQLMLRRRDISATIYFGLTRNPKGNISAHAWLHCGDEILTGGPVEEHYAIVGALTNKNNFRQNFS